MKYFPTLSLGLFAGFLSFFAAPAVAEEAPKITIEQINDGTFSPQYIYGVHPLNDGESYSQLSADGRRITRSSFKTGQETGVLFDLGVSSHQIDTPERGFSYMQDAPLDMRMDQRAQRSAYDVVNTYTAERLTEIFYTYGEERWAKRIASFIEKERQAHPITTTGDLVAVIDRAVPKEVRARGGHPAKRVF